jgi:D-cysteine desulfhydrase
LMLDEVFGAEVRLLDAPDSYSPESLAEANRIADGLRGMGRRSYITEVGGVAEPLADFGYFLGGCELIEQCRAEGIEPGTVLLPIGSGGTHAGMLVGLRARGSTARVIGVSTDPGAKQRAARVRKHAVDLIAWLGLNLNLSETDVFVDDSHSAAGHGIPDDASITAVRLAARTEGLLLDPTYVGKVVAALPSLIDAGLVDSARPTVVVHTGGIVSLFVNTESFASSTTTPAFAP